MMSTVKSKQTTSAPGAAVGKSECQDVPTASPAEGDGLVVAATTLEVEQPPTKGVVQPPAFRDKWFAIAFLVHLVAMFVTAILFHTGVFKTQFPNEEDMNSDIGNGGTRRLVRRFLQEDDEEMEGGSAFSGLIAAVLILTIVAAPAAVMLLMYLMTHKGEKLIKGSWILLIVLTAGLGAVLVSTADTKAVSFVFGVPLLFLALIFMVFAYFTWKRIPYAACNLKIAVQVVRSNMGAFWMSLFVSIPMTVLWIFLWFYIYLHVILSPWLQDHTKTVQVEDDDIFTQSHNVHDETVASGWGTVVLIILLLSLYWTWHVIRNIFHTTFAGTVGTWWFAPHEAAACCSSGLTDSISRSLTYSFGSICFGSLVVAILEVIRSMVRSAARRRGNVLACICVWILAYLDRLAEYFNRYAFCYVGLYGYPYMQAGKQVIALFKYRGWSNLINDVLVHRTLALLSFLVGFFGIGSLVALLGLIVLPSNGEKYGIVTGMWILFGLFAWFIMHRMLMVLQSCMDAILVLYAESPRELEDNYPDLAAELQAAWQKAWPDIFHAQGSRVDEKERAPLSKALPNVEAQDSVADDTKEGPSLSNVV